MFGLFAHLRRQPARDETPADVAMAALLVEAARADGEYAPQEQTVIDRALETLLGLTPSEARALRALAEPQQAEAADTVRFTRIVKFALDYEQRTALIEAMWRVVLTDDVRDEHENALMRRLPPLLGVDDHDAVAARQRAAR